MTPAKSSTFYFKIPLCCLPVKAETLAWENGEAAGTGQHLCAGQW